jgi:hypothetical protein
MFSPGQVWKYHHRPGEENSRLIILKVDAHPKGDIVHIHVNGLRLPNPNVQGGITDVIGHMPYGSASLAACVTALEPEKASLPDFMEGYSQWKQAFDAGKAGYWTVGVKEAIEGIAGAMQGNRG